MVALTADRSTPERSGVEIVDVMGANQSIFIGSIVMRNASGHLIKGATATGSTGVGRAEDRGASTTAGVTNLRVRPGVFRYANSSAGDLLAQVDVGNVCYIVDDQTVAKTSGTGTRSAAGIVRAVDAQGVWVEFNETLTRAMLS